MNPNKAFRDRNRKKNQWGSVPVALAFTSPKILNLQCCTAGCGNELNISMAKGDNIVLNDTVCHICGASHWEWYASDVQTV